MDWDVWLHAPGMPPVSNTYDQGLAQAAYSLAGRWHTCDIMGIGADPPAGASADDIAGWGCAQVRRRFYDEHAHSACCPSLLARVLCRV